MLVKDVMVKADKIILVSPMMPIREALNIMRKTKVKSLVVNKLKPHDAYGMLTYKNILQSIVANDGDIDLLRVYDVYSKPAFQVSEELDVKYAAQVMVNSGVKRLLVIDNNELEGILTMTDILGVVLESVKEVEEE
ncbi:CBS domain-containing protein [Sulfurospirillum arcachonense]|uniref:CBS domain-containing protein n=1 Tax=Sulfurospirillum arcachonense TaxID=57666 RepID=UPI00046A3F87|nr:CBS domain-containing protein [Sulfurospirillum arcachonense]